MIVDSTSPTFSNFGGYPTINDAGTVAFYAELDAGNPGIYKSNGGNTATFVAEGGNGAPSINQSGDVSGQRLMADGSYSEIFKGADSNALQQVARTGVQFRSFDSFPYLGSNGIVVFHAYIYPLSPSRHGIYMGNGDGTTTLLVDNSGSFSVFGGGPTINQEGTIVFAGALKTGEAGLYLTTTAANGVTTILTADSSPIFAIDGSPFINDAGQIAFKAKTDATNMPGIFVVDQDGTNFQTIATADGPYSQFESPIINNSGKVVFLAYLDNGGRGIFTGPDPVADKIIELGDSLFGSTVSSVVFRRGLNNKNEISFYYGLADGRFGIAKASPHAMRTSSMRSVSGTMTLTIDSQSNHSYQLQFSTTLDPDSFVDIGAPQTGQTGTQLTFSDSPATAAGFYRIKMSILPATNHARTAVSLPKR